MKKAAFHNLGCKVNSYELDIMRQILREEGYEEVPFQERADIYVVNTCTVTNIADRKSRQMLHRARKQNPEAVVVAVGCYVETDPDRVEKDDAVDLVIGNNKKTQVGQILRDFLKESKEAGESKDTVRRAKPVFREDLTCAPAYEDMQLTTPGHTRAFIKIQDGCNQFCSYCIIPFARGRIRSRAKEEILREVEGLARRGIREIVLTGIHVSSYGLDLPDPEEVSAATAAAPTVSSPAAPSQEAPAGNAPGAEAAAPQTAEPAASSSPAAEPAGAAVPAAAPDAEEASPAERAVKPGAPVRFDPVRAGAALLSLLTDLNAVEGIARIRLSSLEPRIMTESFIRRLSKLEKVCPHFHLSLQSGCDETLRRMNRHYTTEEYFRSVRLLRTFYDRPAITTDVIVGFPGETEAEFAATCAFLEKIRFYEIHVFRYSKRNGTVAAKMKNQIPEPVKAVRSDRLLAMTAAQAADYRAQFAGEPETLLLEELLEEQGGKYWVGSTARYVTGAVPAAEIAGEGPAGPAGTLLRGSFTARCLPFSRGEAMLFLPAEERGREPGRNNLPAADA